jgi:hypothetical protein
MIAGIVSRGSDLRWGDRAVAARLGALSHDSRIFQSHRTRPRDDNRGERSPANHRQGKTKDEAPESASVGRENQWATLLDCASRFAFSRSYCFAAAAAAIVYFPVQVYSNPPSAVPVVLQVPDPLIPFTSRCRLRCKVHPWSWPFSQLRFSRPHCWSAHSPWFLLQVGAFQAARNVTILSE